jgi:hypothetical protein
MNWRDRRIWFGLVIVAAIVLLSIVAAPSSNRQTVGSTFSRAPDGYGAWYAYMQQQGIAIERWQRPYSDFVEQRSGDRASGDRQRATLLQVNPDLVLATGFFANSSANSKEQEWLKKGNTLVILGLDSPVTAAPFSSLQESPDGKVKVVTGRRYPLPAAEEELLGDRFGAIVWQRSIGKGRIIYVNTPHLAANAYQDEPGNFAFLARLVKQNGNAVWVDEYLHGYKEAAIAAQEGAGDWFTYLARTPLLPIFVQSSVLLLILIAAQNRRFGSPLPLVSPKTENSEAYIQALAGVLHQAGRSEFVVDVVGKEENLQVQRALGLGAAPVEPDLLLKTWQEQTDRPTAELAQILPKSSKPRMSEQELLTWIKNLQTVRQNLP